MIKHVPKRLAGAATLMFLLTACGGDDDAIPQLAPASGAALGSCTDLPTRFSFANTTITGANAIAAGVQTIAGTPVEAHCQVTGTMFQRTSTVDSKTYAIGFEMRLPNSWNGRFYYQANGGIDGSVVPATGPNSGGGPLTNALQQGFAVISSDAGHNGSQNPTFGIDPQARLDYGYQAVGKLTPMAKSLISTAYGKAPDRSYIGGCSNGGRHTMVATARYADQYDGYLVGDPGTVLPRAAIANLAGGQTYSALATDPGDPGTGFTLAERRLVSAALLARCDALDGVADGMVQDTKACQAAFDLDRDVPTCAGARDGSCLSPAQKSGIGRLFAGATTAAGSRVYASFPYDAGLATADWASWKFAAPSTRDAGAVANIWQVPPANPAGFDGRAFMRAGNVDAWLASVQATDSTYKDAALSFMTPPHLADFSAVRKRGAKIVMFHGTSDPIFSSDHSVAVYEGWSGGSGASAASFARLYLVPGMNHCRAGPSTDQFDLLTPLVAWVEQGKAPEAVIATARGPGNPAGANADVPPDWSPQRTRPLCPYPAVARYDGRGDVESAASFACR